MGRSRPTSRRCRRRRDRVTGFPSTRRDPRCQVWADLATHVTLPTVRARMRGPEPADAADNACPDAVADGAVVRWDDAGNLWDVKPRRAGLPDRITSPALWMSKRCIDLEPWTNQSRDCSPDW